MRKPVQYLSAMNKEVQKSIQLELCLKSQAKYTKWSNRTADISHNFTAAKSMHALPE